MKVVALEQDAKRFGVVQGDRIVELTERFNGDFGTLLQTGGPQLRKLVDAMDGRKKSLPFAGTALHAPVRLQSRIFGIGLNYAEHAAESKMQPQKVPTVFLKLPSSAIGEGADIVLPGNSTQPDYEVELGVVIGTGGYRIAAEDWQQHVFGYTIVNDVSARDVQLATTQWTLGKSFPTFTPMGPWIATADGIHDPHALDVRLSIDGEVLQDSNTRDLIFRIPQLIEYISSITPLFPGDVISTGTPQGVGLGRTPQRWLRPDETVRLTISGIGDLTNRTRAEG